MPRAQCPLSQGHPPGSQETLQTGSPGGPGSYLGSRMQVDGMMAVPSPCPTPNALRLALCVLKRHCHPLNLSIEKESGLCSNQGDPDVIARESQLTGASRCVECVQQRSVPARTPATSLLVLLAFACYTDRRGRGKRILASYRFPLSHEATVLRI